MHPWKYLVKCRPFLSDFMLSLMPNFQIFFYTAGLRSYGLLIMDIIKNLLSKNPRSKNIEGLMN